MKLDMDNYVVDISPYGMPIRRMLRDVINRIRGTLCDVRQNYYKTSNESPGNCTRTQKRPTTPNKSPRNYTGTSTYTKIHKKHPTFTFGRKHHPNKSEQTPSQQLHSNVKNNTLLTAPWLLHSYDKMKKVFLVNE